MTRMVDAAVVFVCMTAASCSVNQDAQRPVDHGVVEEKPRYDCPPLPLLSKEATVFEKRVWEMTVIELYRQCAESKK